MKSFLEQVIYVSYLVDHVGDVNDPGDPDGPGGPLHDMATTTTGSRILYQNVFQSNQKDTFYWN